MRRLLILASAVLLAGCGLIEALADRSYEYDYRLFNASDHVVYMQLKEVSYEDVFPEELTLQPGEDFFWKRSSGGAGHTEPAPFQATTITIIFDDTYKLRQFPPGFSECEIENRGKKELPLATYTLTNADYEYAVEHGTVVESGQIQ